MIAKQPKKKAHHIVFGSNAATNFTLDLNTVRPTVNSCLCLNYDHHSKTFMFLRFPDVGAACPIIQHQPGRTRLEENAQSSIYGICERETTFDLRSLPLSPANVTDPIYLILLIVDFVASSNMINDKRHVNFTRCTAKHLANK
jgi:hypothetical protein